MEVMKSKKLKNIIAVIVLAVIITVLFYKSWFSKVFEKNPNYYSSKQLERLMDKDYQIRTEVLFLQYYHNTRMKNIELRNNDYILEKDGVIPRDRIQVEMQSMQKCLKQ